MARNGGQHLADCLLGLGARRGFGVPGESYLALLDGFYDHRDGFDFVICRQEGGAAYMAEAWAKLTGEPGLCFVTRGPGATNASIGVHTAMQNSTPMILFVGQAARGDLGREAFQEVDYRAFFGDIAKWVVEIDDPARIREILARAWVTCQSGRPGPVVISLPEDVLSATVADEPLGRVLLPSEPAPRPADVEAAAAMLAGAVRPLVIAGGGGWTAGGRAALAGFAARQNIPIAVSFRRHSLFDNRNEAFVGEAGVGMLPYLREAIAAADVVLALNMRFGEMATGAWTLFDVPLPRQTVIHAHASDRELGKVVQPALAIQAGPNEMARALEALPHGQIDAGWRAELRTSYLAGLEAPEQPGALDMAAVMRHLRTAMPEDAVVTSGAGNFSIWNNKYFDYGPGQLLLAPQNGTMGFGLPAAVAAKIENPARTVVCFAGDGDFQMNMAELGTGLQKGNLPVVLILNNGTYGTIRMHQERHYPERISGTAIVSPDFPTLGRAYGMHTERVERTADFGPAFERALAAPGGALLDLVVDPEGIAPRLTIGGLRADARARVAPG